MVASAAKSASAVQPSYDFVADLIFLTSPTPKRCVAWCAASIFVRTTSFDSLSKMTVVLAFGFLRGGRAGAARDASSSVAAAFSFFHSAFARRFSRFRASSCSLSFHPARRALLRIACCARSSAVVAQPSPPARDLRAARLFRARSLFRSFLSRARSSADNAVSSILEISHSLTQW